MAFPEQPSTPLPAVARLVTLLAKKGRLTGEEPYEMFDRALAANMRRGAGGTTACLALGMPIGRECRTGNGKCGDIVLDMSPAEVAELRPGLSSGWVAVEQTPAWTCCSFPAW